SYCCQAQKIFITLKPGNCLNCSSKIYELERTKNIESMTVIMESNYYSDSTEIEALFEFNSLNKVRVKYSDSIYNHLVSNRDYPELTIINNTGKVIYQKVLLESKIKEVVAILNNEKHKHNKK